jgi:COMPASS component SPP1
MEQSSSLGQSENSRSEPFGNDAKSDSIAQTPSDAQNFSSKTPLHPSTSTEQPTNMGAQTAAKKKGTASTIKKSGKRSTNTGGPRAAKRAKSVQSGSTSGEAPESAGSELEESDHGPYCICRGADDHRWMIFCENCEDWYHGECIDLNKEIGESLIERFICPLCTTDDRKTIYKKTCSLSGCRKAARLTDEEPSVFCSNEHTQIWWERMVAKLPKGKGKGGNNDQLTQEEFMALLGSGLSGFDENGLWRLVKEPFSGETKAANGIGKGKSLLFNMYWTSD